MYRDNQSQYYITKTNLLKKNPFIENETLYTQHTTQTTHCIIILMTYLCCTLYSNRVGTTLVLTACAYVLVSRSSVVVLLQYKNKMLMKLLKLEI